MLCDGINGRVVWQRTSIQASSLESPASSREVFPPLICCRLLGGAISSALRAALLRSSILIVKGTVKGTRRGGDEEAEGIDSTLMMLRSSSKSSKVVQLLHQEVSRCVGQSVDSKSGRKLSRDDVESLRAVDGEKHGHA